MLHLLLSSFLSLILFFHFSGESLKFEFILLIKIKSSPLISKMSFNLLILMGKWERIMLNRVVILLPIEWVFYFGLVPVIIQCSPRMQDVFTDRIDKHNVLIAVFGKRQLFKFILSKRVVFQNLELFCLNS